MPRSVLDLYVNDLFAVPLMTKREFIEQFKIYKANRDNPNPIAQRTALRARNKIVEGNMRLVLAIAKRRIVSGAPLEDLISEGVEGLITAVEKFDVARGYAFSTYAFYWIKLTIARAIDDKYRTIREPIYFAERVRAMKRFSSKYEQQHGRSPSLEEIAQALNVSPDVIRNTQRKHYRVGSLDWKPKGIKDRDSIGELLADEGTSPEEYAIALETKQTLQNALDSIDPIRAETLILYYGLDDGEPKPLTAIAERFSISKQAASNWVKKAKYSLHEALRRENNRGGNSYRLARQMAIARLPEQTRHVLELRYGTDGRSPKTFIEMAEVLGVTRQRASALVVNAEKQLELQIGLIGQEVA